MSDGLSFTFGGHREWGAAVDDMLGRLGLAAREIVSLGGQMIVERVMPEVPVVSGTLRRSVHVDTVEPIGPGTWRSVTGPSVIYARRVDLGFHGADSLGRIYDQEGNPYFERGTAGIEAPLGSLAAERWAVAMRR